MTHMYEQVACSCCTGLLSSHRQNQQHAVVVSTLSRRAYLHHRVGSERRRGHKRRASSDGVASPPPEADRHAAAARAAAAAACDAVTAAILGALQQPMSLPQRDVGLAFWTSCIAPLNAQVSPQQGSSSGVVGVQFAILGCSRLNTVRCSMHCSGSEVCLHAVQFQHTLQQSAEARRSGVGADTEAADDAWLRALLSIIGELRIAAGL
jgi:hypothetical protein